MADDASAYAALGLGPGADSGEIEQAYKRLIKQHHPDREGGDARRAAEINRAYRELRAHRNLKDPLELNPDLGMPNDNSIGWPLVAIVVGVGIVAALLLGGPTAPGADAGRSPPGTVRATRAIGSDLMDRPLNQAAIIAATRRATSLSRTRDEMTLASESRDCHQKLRRDPSLLQLDRCAAFDTAVVQLQDRDPLRDQGPFSELAVTGRLRSGATELSDDYVAIDGRLDRIRLQVELALAPPLPPPPASSNAN